MNNEHLLADILVRIMIVIPIAILVYVLKIALKNHSKKQYFFSLNKKEKKDIFYGLVLFFSSLFVFAFILN